MIRGGGVGDVGASETGHVALQTALAEVGDSFVGRRQSMRIMAANAAHFAVAGSKAAADVHLLDLTDGSVVASQTRRQNKDSPELMEWQAGTVVEGLSTRREYSVLGQQMALLANRFAESG